MTHDDLAIQAQQDYQLYLCAIAGIYLGPVAAGMARVPSVSNAMRSNMQTALENMTARMQQGMQWHIDGLGLGNQHFDVMQGFVDAGTSLLEQIAGWGSQHVDQLQRQFRLGGGSVSDDESGALGMVLQKNSMTIPFKVKDTSGRSWDAPSLVRVEVRQWAYQSGIQAQFALHSGDLFNVVYRDEGHENHGLTFSASGQTEGYPAFGDLQETVFHPNATAWVEPYVPS